MSLANYGNLIQQLLGKPTPRQIREEEQRAGRNDDMRQLLFAEEFGARRKQREEEAKEKQQAAADKISRENLAKAAHAVTTAEKYVGAYNKSKNPADIAEGVKLLSESGNSNLAQLLPLIAQGDEGAKASYDAAKYGILFKANALDAVESPEKKKTNRMIEAEAIGYKPGSEEYKAYVERTEDGEVVNRWKFYRGLPEDQKSEFMSLIREKGGFSSTTEKKIYEAADAAQTARLAYANYDDLAKRYADTTQRGGVVGGFREWIKETAGTEDAFSEMRKGWIQVKVSQAMKNLPPGPASDRDVENAMKGFPGDDANPEMIASFLRGMTKMARWDAEYQDFKADFISQNGGPQGLNEAWKAHAAKVYAAGNDDDRYGVWN